MYVLLHSVWLYSACCVAVELQLYLCPQCMAAAESDMAVF